MNHYEANDQEAIFKWAAYMSGQCPELKLLYHIPNEGKRAAYTGHRLKLQGMKAGVPDMCLPVARGSFHGLYIELKHGKHKPTPEQTQWIHNLREQGYCAAVCYGWEETVRFITNYLNNKLIKGVYDVN